MALGSTLEETGWKLGGVDPKLGGVDRTRLATGLKPVRFDLQELGIGWKLGRFGPKQLVVGLKQ